MSTNLCAGPVPEVRVRPLNVASLGSRRSSWQGSAADDVPAREPAEGDRSGSDFSGGRIDTIFAA